MKNYRFTVVINADAENADDAWNKAVEEFAADPGVYDSYTSEDVEDDQ